jgi:hypothetical protein
MQPPPQMYPGYAPKQMMPMKPQGENQKFDNFKHHQPDYPMHPMHYPQPGLQKYPPMKMDQPNYGMHIPPPYHNIQNQNKMNPINQIPLNLPAPPPQVNQYQNQNVRAPVFDRPKER